MKAYLAATGGSAHRHGSMLSTPSVLRYCVTSALRVTLRYSWLRHRVTRYSREELRYSCVTALQHWLCPLAPHADMKSFEPWRLERLAASGFVWLASGRRLDVWASGRLGHVWFTSGHV